MELRLEDQGLQRWEDGFRSLRRPGRIKRPALEHESKRLLVAKNRYGGDAQIGELVC